MLSVAGIKRNVGLCRFAAVEDKSGRPRQRVLANLYGEPDTLRALAKLAARHELLLQLQGEERAEPDKRGAGFVLVTERAEHQLSRRAG